MQKIIDNNARFSTKPQFFQEFNPHEGGDFFVEFQEFSPTLYVFKAKDDEHALTCEMTLELKDKSFYLKGKKSEELMPILACKFPSIDVHELNKKVCWEEYLQGILMIQFHLKILEQLLLFCEEKDTLYLSLAFKQKNSEYLEIYRRFFISKTSILHSQRDEIEIIIPTNVKTYDDLLEFMNEIDNDFRETLWQNQAINPIFRAYIKTHPLWGF